MAVLHGANVRIQIGSCNPYGLLSQIGEKYLGEPLINQQNVRVSGTNLGGLSRCRAF